MQGSEALEIENEKLQEKQDELTADVYLLAQENAKLKLQVDGLFKVRHAGAIASDWPKLAAHILELYCRN
jgi:hypothetical protein